jgi:hypothetical protein
VVAVEVHQNALTSSDIAWAMQLEAIVSSFVPDLGPSLHMSRNAPNGTVTLTWLGGACGGVLRQTTNLLSANTVWTDVPGNPNGSYTFTPTPGTQRFFSLRQ